MKPIRNSQLNKATHKGWGFNLPCDRSSHTEYGNAVLEAPPPLLAAEPPGTAFPARGWKRDLKRLLAKVDTNGHCRAPTGVPHTNEKRYI